jgi:Predicted metal-dependent hydrolase
MEKHQIILDDQLYTYELHLKKIKSIYIKVIDGQIVVSAPLYTSIHSIEELLIQYQDKLIDKVCQYKPNIEYRDEGIVKIYNHDYIIKLRDINQKKCVLHDHYLYVYHHSLENVIDIFLKKLLLDYIEERIIYYLTYHFDLDMPRIEIKHYKGRWGSCFYKENKVTFNLSLVHLEKDLIDYVIVHELCHFLQANHSRYFYNEIEKRIPNYKECIRRLKEVHP